MTTVIASVHGRRGAALEVRPLSPEDLPALAALGARCSRESLYHRFHGFIDLPTYLKGLFASKQITVVAWVDARCVGFASLARSPYGHDVGVLVEDEWQQRGVGSALFNALVASARERQIRRIHADVLFEDAFSLRVLARSGRTTVTLDYGVYSVLVDLDAASD
jgi:GNAT superfamily N-acetyltransferase